MTAWTVNPDALADAVVMEYANQKGTPDHRQDEGDASQNEREVYIAINHC